MTVKQRTSLVRYIRLIADMMGLRDWTFELDNDPTDANDLAHIEPIFGQRRAIIAVSAGFAGCPPEFQRKAIVHELTHAHQAARTHLVHRALPSLLGEAGWSAFESAYRLEDELATDSLATGIEPFFPLWEG